MNRNYPEKGKKQIHHLFQPGQIGKMGLRNRTVMAPLGTNLPDLNGAVTPRLIDWYAERAWGGVGLVIVEGASANPLFGLGRPQALRIDSPRLIPGLNELVEAVQAAGARIAAQISVSGAGIDPELEPGGQPLAVGASPMTYIFDAKNPGLTHTPRMKRTKRVRALTREEMEEIKKSYLRAAGIAKAAGFDAIEIHGAHGYLMAGFLSPLSNSREDEYGGSLAGRSKYAAEILTGIRGVVGPDFPLIFRLSGREYTAGGREIEESCLIAKKLEELGVNALHVSAGISMRAESFAWMNPPMAFPQGAFIEDAHAIKKAVQIPIIAVGKIRDPEYAEQILEEGKADFVALGRTLVADPEWPQKAQQGRTREIRRCISCNRCMRIMSRRIIRCTLNARAGLEREFPMAPAPQKVRVAVIGGGPAGMEAARVAALRGHRVTLYEKERALGGQLRLAIVPPFKKDLSRMLADLVYQIKNLGVEICLNRKIHSEDLENLPCDELILATGGIPPKEIPERFNPAMMVSAWDVLSGKARLKGLRIVVLGNGRVACETAEFLALRKKKEVTIIHEGPREEIGSDLEPIFEWRLLMERLEKHEVKILTDARILTIDQEGVHLQEPESLLVPCDHVVWDRIPFPEKLLGETLKSRKFAAAGDCIEPRNLYHAIHEGFRAAYRI